jgi:kynureninase
MRAARCLSSESPGRACGIVHGPMTKDIRDWRQEFPILEKTTYLISNSLGAMPRGAATRLAEYADTWARRGVRVWERNEAGWWDMPVTVGDLVAPIIGAPAGSVTMQPNVTLAEAVVLSCFDVEGRRNKIVFEQENFPSVQYFYCAQPGLRIRRVPVNRLVDAIDEETLLVPISHVLFRNSYVQDVRAIVDKAHRVGAHVVLDVFQAAGCLPLSVTELGVDFAVGGCLKWLCGGPGNGYLYVRPDLHRLRPRLTGWVAHAAPFAFEPPPIRYAEGAFRFLNGTPNIPGLYAATEGLRIIAEVGVARIRARSLELTSRLLEQVLARGWPSSTPRDPDRRGGTVAIGVSDGDRICQALLERDFFVDFRPEAGIRVSPHFYNTEAECDALVAEIAALERPAGQP